MDDDYPPDEVMQEWAKHCFCCPVCGHSPCEGVMAGGPCDDRDCECDTYDGPELM